MLWYKALSASLMLGFVPLAAHGASWVQYWRQLDHSAYVQVGHGPVVVYDFFDPNCSYCPAPYKLEQQFIQEGKLTVRYVPVGFLTPSSLGKSAAILEAPNPPTALAVDMEGVVQNGTGGVRAIDPDAAARVGLQYNRSMLIETGVDIVPDLVFRLPDGHVGMIKGVFPDSVLRDIVRGRMP